MAIAADTRRTGGARKPGGVFFSARRERAMAKRKTARRRKDQVHVRLRPGSAQTLRELAGVRGVTVNSIVDEAVAQWLTRAVEAAEPPVSGRVLAMRAHADRTLEAERRRIMRGPHS